jgi:hypothetical protein
MKTLEGAIHSSEHSPSERPPPKHGECKSFDQRPQPDLDPLTWQKGVLLQGGS